MTCIATKEQEDKVKSWWAKLERAKKYPCSDYSISDLDFTKDSWRIGKPTEFSKLMLVKSDFEGELELYQIPPEFLKLLEVYKNQKQRIVRKAED